MTNPASTGTAEENLETAGRNEKAQLGPLQNYVGFHLRLAQNASFKAFKRITGEEDLRPGWFAVLSLIHVNPGITPLTLSKASGRDKSTLTPVLRDLLRNRLVARMTLKTDKRSYSLSLTEEGEAKLASLTRQAAEHDRILDDIVGTKKDEFIWMLRRIAALLD